MSRLRIQVESIVSDGFDLELPHDEGGGSDRVVLAKVGRLHGTYEHDARQIRLRRVGADTLGVAQLAWHWPGGRVVLPGRGDVEGLLLDLAIAKDARKTGRRLTGTITAARATLGEIGLDVEGARLACELAVTGLDVREPSDTSPSTIVVGSAIARAVHASAGEVPITVGEIHLDHLRVERDGASLGLSLGRARGEALRLRVGDVQIAAASFTVADVALDRDEGGLDLQLGAVDLQGVEIDLGATQLRLDRLVLPGGLRWSGDELSIPALKLDAAQVAARLPSPTPAPARRPPAGGAPPSAGRRRKQRADLRFLDRLGGRFDVDATVDARVPFLKRRLATHHFRVPIDHGTIDYKKLEGDLSLLEDSLLDFEVRRGKLVLEVKPPILRFAKKTLVDWPLEEGELALAERHRVHLRTLASPHLHTGDERDDGARKEGDPAFELTRLDLDPIEADLRLGGPAEIAVGGGVLHLGTAREAGIGALTVRGALHHRARGDGAPTELAIAAEKIRLAAEGVALGGWAVSAEAVALGGIEDGVVTLHGAHPSSARAVLRKLFLRGLRLARASLSRASPSRVSPASRRRR